MTSLLSGRQNNQYRSFVHTQTRGSRFRSGVSWLKWQWVMTGILEHKRAPCPQVLTLQKGVGFIAWCLSRHHFRGMPTVPRGIFGAAGCVWVSILRTNPPKNDLCATLVRLVGRMTNTCSRFRLTDLQLETLYLFTITFLFVHNFAVTSILLYGCTTWTLTIRLEKLDGNYTRMLRAILNKSWRQHPTRHQLYGHLPPITKTIQVRRIRHAGHCWRSRDELIRDVLLWTPHMAVQKQDDQHEHTFSSYARIRDVVLKTYLGR